MGMLINSNGKKVSFKVSKRKEGETEEAYDKRRFAVLGKTNQSAKDECDINRIVMRAMAHGLPDMADLSYGDVSDISPESYLEMKNHISHVNGVYESLPSDMRRYYGSAEAFLNAKFAEHVEKLNAEAESESSDDSLVIETPPAESAESVVSSDEGSGA